MTPASQDYRRGLHRYHFCISRLFKIETKSKSVAIHSLVSVHGPTEISEASYGNIGSYPKTWAHFHIYKGEDVVSVHLDSGGFYAIVRVTRSMAAQILKACWRFNEHHATAS